MMTDNSFENFYQLSEKYGNIENSNQFSLNNKPFIEASVSINNSQMDAEDLSDKISAYYDKNDDITKKLTKTLANSYLSKIEQDILRSNLPIDLNEDFEEITINGEKGILMNKSEISDWKGELPLNNYSINEDKDPEVIHKRTSHQILYKQDMAIRYLRPPTPPPPGDIYIRQKDIQMPAAPPLIIRQQPPRPETPPPLVIREAPPTPPQNLGPKIIYIQGKKIPPPPRKVIIERLPPLPSKPQSIIIERWLPYKPLKRKVIFQRANENDPILVKSKNLIVQWEKPSITVKKEFKDLGIVKANPLEYVERYGTSLKKSDDLPNFIQDIKPPLGITLASQSVGEIPFELEGDLHALKYVDLESEGLNEYKNLLQQLNLESNKKVLEEHLKKPIESENTSLTNNMTNGTEKKIDFISDLFNLVDLNSTISMEEAENILFGLYTRLGKRYGKPEANNFFNQIEFNNNGSIDLMRFRKILEKEFL